MDMFSSPAAIGEWHAPAAVVALMATAVSCASLLLLHIVSPEFAPSWRMVSEYANGRFHWMLTLVFISWAISSFALAWALSPVWASSLGKVGLVFLLLGGIGQVMGGLFDINHQLHGPAAMIGIPSLCVAAVTLTLAMSRRSGISAPPHWSAHLPWISFALMLVTLAMFFSALKRQASTWRRRPGHLPSFPPASPAMLAGPTG